MNKDLLKSFDFLLDGHDEYSITYSKFTRTDNLFLLFVKEDLNESLLIPTNMYSLDIPNSKIRISMVQSEYKYGMLCERPNLISFDWNVLTSLTDLQFAQLNGLYTAFKNLSLEVHNMFDNANFALLTNNIDKNKYVFPKLKTDEVFMMSNEGLVAFDLKAIYDEYEAKFVQFTTLLEGYKQNVLDQEVIIGTQRDSIAQQITLVTTQAETLRGLETLYADILATLNTISVGDLSALTTTEKSNLVGAISEIDTALKAYKLANDLRVLAIENDETTVRTINGIVATGNEITLDTDDIQEGTINLYFTDARALSAVELDIEEISFLNATLYG